MSIHPSILLEVGPHIGLTEAFCLRGAAGEPEWYLMVDEVVVKATWNSKGAAEAAIPIERARRAKKEGRP